ncbi:MAG: hypothetical protein ACI85O_002314 [Saprospiraceae bacterium]|jgi:hypothetical protein
MLKPRVVKDYEKLDEIVQQQIKLTYPHGFHKHLVKFKNAKGDTVSALPFETDERYYLVRMTVEEARIIIKEDDDFDDKGNLINAIKEDYEDKFEKEFEEEGLDIGEE